MLEIVREIRSQYLESVRDFILEYAGRVVISIKSLTKVFSCLISLAERDLMS